MHGPKNELHASAAGAAKPRHAHVAGIEIAVDAKSLSL